MLRKLPDHKRLAAQIVDFRFHIALHYPHRRHDDDDGKDADQHPQSDADQYTYLAKPTVTALSPKTGPAAGGTTVTVTGTNLASATSVTFGGTAVTPTSVTGTSLKAVSPAGTAGDVHVVVHTTLAGDSTESDADLFTYTG